MVFLVIVTDFDISWTGGCPYKADPPLIVDSYAVLPGSISLEGFQLVPRWRSKVGQHNGGVQVIQLAQRDACDVTEPLGCPGLVQLPGVAACEGLDCHDAEHNTSDVIRQGVSAGRLVVEANTRLTAILPVRLCRPVIWIPSARRVAGEVAAMTARVAPAFRICRRRGSAQHEDREDTGDGGELPDHCRGRLRRNARPDNRRQG
jgi:hypothetical protein